MLDTIPGIPELAVTGATEPIPAAPEPAPEPQPQAGEPAKRKRHRRTKAELEAAKSAAAPPALVAAPSTEDLDRCRLGFAMIFGLVSKALTKKWGEEMELTEEEVATLAGAWTDAVAPYLPQAGKSMPIATAAVATLLIALPRWDVYQEQKARNPYEPPVPS